MVFQVQKFVTPLLFSLSVVLFALLPTGCGNLDKKKYYRKQNDSNQSAEITENVTIEYTDSGHLRARVKCKILKGVKDVKEPYAEMPKGVNVDFLDNCKRRKSWLSAGYAISYAEKKTIFVRNAVEIVNIKGEKLETEELEWNQKTQRIRTDKNVKITTRDKVFFGQGLESNQTFTEWEIKNITGTIFTHNAENDSIARVHTTDVSGDCD